MEQFSGMDNGSFVIATFGTGVSAKISKGCPAQLGSFVENGRLIRAI